MAINVVAQSTDGVKVPFWDRKSFTPYDATWPTPNFNDQKAL